MAQESFNFDFNEPLADDDFIVSESNLSAFSYIEKWPDWDGNIFLLYGPKASGKTHLCNIWQRKSDAEFIGPQEIYANNYNVEKNYIVDRIEYVHDEAALFHFFNQMKEANAGYLLLVSDSHPANSSIRLPDLRSRLNAVASAGVSDPDDELLRTIFVKQFSDRQLKVDMDVINYIIARMERSFKALYDIVDKLDKQALEEKKNITIPFVKKVAGFEVEA